MSHAFNGAVMHTTRSIVLAVLVLILAQGCAVGGGPRRVGGDRLSDAAAEAKKEPEEKRKLLWAGDVVEEGDEVDWFALLIEVVSYFETVATDEYSAPRVRTHPPSIYNGFHLGAVGGFGTPSSDTFDGHSLAGLQVGVFPFERTRFDAALLRAGTSFSPASGLNESFRRESDYALDLSGRYYMTPEHSAVGVYPVAGVQMGVLCWDYASPVLIEDYGIYSAASDYMMYVSPYFGLGTSLVQTRHFHFGVQLVGGMRVYNTYTGQGLQNDLFKDEDFWQLRFEMTAPF